MRTNKLLLGSLFTTMALTANVHGGQMFPIVTNNGDTGFSFATDGTNYLAGIQGDYVTINEYQITAQMFGPTGALIVT